jgi:YggT family protein
VNALSLALGRADIADYVDALFLVYFILILASIVLSWIPRLPYNRVLHAVVSFVHDVTQPYLRIFRRFLPPIGGGGFALDLSPIIGIILLLIAQQIVVGLIRP